MHADCVDLSHGDSFGPNACHNIVKAHVKAVIHKASEGLSMTDTQCLSRLERVVRVGLLAGSYHFLRPGDGGRQFAHYKAAMAGFKHDFLPMLDVEDENGSAPDLGDVLDWKRAAKAEWGVAPMIYGSDILIQMLNESGADELEDCPFMIAKYESEHPPVLPNAFPLRFWQYSPARGEQGYCGVLGYDSSQYLGADSMAAMWVRHQVKVSA